MNWLATHLRIFIICLSALWLSACNSISTGPMNHSRFDKATLDRELQAMVSTTKPEVVNVNALAIHNGKVVYQNQFGRRHIDLTGNGKDLPVNENTLFRIASVSKMVTAITVMRLVEQGKLNLDDDVSKALGWTLRNPNFPDTVITLRQLLTHRSSLTDGNESYSFDVEVNLKDILTPSGSRYKAGEHWQDNKKPGTWFDYCNFGFGVIATVMERATGERFDRLVSKLVLQPMQIKGGFNIADLNASDIPNVATQYRKRRNEGGKEVWDSNGPWIVQADDFQTQPPSQIKNVEKYVIGNNGTLFGPQGRLRISLADLGKLMQMLMNQGVFNQQVLLQPATVAALMAPQWQFSEGNGNTEGGGNLAWAVGGQIFTDTGKDRFVAANSKGVITGFGHLGDAYGLMASFVMNPSTKTGFITIVCGPSVNPETYPAQYSALYRWQEIANGAVLKSLNP